MYFQKFLSEIEAEIRVLYSKNPLLGLTVFFIAILRQVVEKDKTLAKRVDEYLKLMGPLIELFLKLGPDKMYDLADFKIPDMRGRVKPKRFQNIYKEYEGIYENIKPILKRKYKNPEAKLLHLKERLKGFPKEKLREWVDLEPRMFVAQCVAYKHGYNRCPETILRNVRKEKKVKRIYKSLSNQLSELVRNLSSQKFPPPPIPS